RTRFAAPRRRVAPLRGRTLGVAAAAGGRRARAGRAAADDADALPATSHVHALVARAALGRAGAGTAAVGTARRVHEAEVARASALAAVGARRAERPVAHHRPARAAHALLPARAPGRRAVGAAA